jgi:hypothetical protein
MRHRRAISDANWDRIKDLLPGRPGEHGGVAKDNRLFIYAVLRTSWQAVAKVRWSPLWPSTAAGIWAM